MAAKVYTKGDTHLFPSLKKQNKTVQGTEYVSE